MYENRKSTNDLKHYGVKGMQWRRGRNLSGIPDHLKDTIKNQESNNYKTESDPVSKIADSQRKNRERALKYIEKRLKQSKSKRIKKKNKELSDQMKKEKHFTTSRTKENNKTISRRLSYLKNKEKELKHYGVKGMHWGSRKGKTIQKTVNRTEGNGFRSVVYAVGTDMYRTVRNPLISSSNAAKNFIKHPILSSTSPIMMKKKHNSDVRKDLMEKARYKSAAKRDRIAKKSLKAQRKAQLSDLKDKKIHAETSKERRAFAKRRRSIKKKFKKELKRIRRYGYDPKNSKLQKEIHDKVESILKQKRKHKRQNVRNALRRAFLSKDVINYREQQRKKFKTDGDLEHSEDLKHYGVKGMKWGIRRWLKNREIKKREREQKEERNLDKDFYAKKNEKQRVKSWEYQRKHMGKMNNRQLKSRVERLEMENRIIRTMNEQRSSKLDHIKKIIEISNSAANLYKTIKSTGGSNNKSNGKNQNGSNKPIKREKKAQKFAKKALRNLG